VSRRQSLAYALVASVVGALVWLHWGGIRKGIWIDLDVYLRGASSVLSHEPHESLYGFSVHGQPFTYPPFAALVFAPLEALGTSGARWLMTAVSVGCYLGIVVLGARRLRMHVAPAVIVGLAGLAFEPFVRNILLGQINLLLVAMVVVDVLVVPARCRGILIGVAAGIKLVPGAFVLFLLLKGEWGAALRSAGAFAATVGLGAILAPGDSWQFWSGGFVDLSRFGADAVIRGDNQSLTGAVMRLSHDLSPPPPLLLLASACVMALGVVAARRQIDSGHDLNGLVCIAFAALLASPISWTHHWIWAVVAMLVLVQARHHVAAVMLGAIFTVGPMWFAPRGQLLELSHSWSQALACLSYVAVGLTYLTFFVVSGKGPEPGSTGWRELARGIGRTDDVDVGRSG